MRHFTAQPDLVGTCCSSRCSYNPPLPSPLLTHVETERFTHPPLCCHASSFIISLFPLLLSLPSPAVVHGHAAVLPQPEQHPDGSVPPQPRGEEQLRVRELLQRPVAERPRDRGLPRLPQQAQVPDVLRWEVSQPGVKALNFTCRVWYTRDVSVKCAAALYFITFSSVCSTSLLFGWTAETLVPERWTLFENENAQKWIHCRSGSTGHPYSWFKTVFVSTSYVQTLAAFRLRSLKNKH